MHHSQNADRQQVATPPWQPDKMTKQSREEDSKVDGNCDEIDYGPPLDDDEDDEPCSTHGVPLGLGFFARVEESGADAYQQGEDLHDVTETPVAMGFFSRLDQLDAQTAATDAEAAAEAAAETAERENGGGGGATEPADPVPEAASSQNILFGENTPIPVFSSLDEEQELATLTADEIAASEADVLGLTADMAGASIRDGHDPDVASKALEVELARMLDDEKAAYVEAMQRCPEQVDEEHKKAFLWREDYDVKLAARRLVRYWEHRRAVFGAEKCYLPFTMSGALRDDIDAIQNCIIWLLPVQDARGRTMVMWDFNRFDPSLSNESLLRACWYTFHVACRDPTTRERGFVFLFRPTIEAVEDVGDNSQLFWTFGKLIKHLFELETDYLPMMFRGVHWCKPSRLFHLTNPVIKYCFGKRLRGRFKVHYGSDEEAVLKSLESYGLPRSRLPIELGGDVLHDHDQWVVERVAEECGAEGIVAAAALLGVNISSSDDDPSQIQDPKLHSGARSDLRKQMPSQSDSGNPNQDQVTGMSELEMDSARRRYLSRMNQDIPLHDGPRDDRKTPNVVSPPLVSCDEGGTSDSVPDDPRMEKAVQLMLDDPNLTCLEALASGGYEYPSWKSDKVNRVLVDAENVSLFEREQELKRRMLDLSWKAYLNSTKIESSGEVENCSDQKDGQGSSLQVQQEVPDNLKAPSGSLTPEFVDEPINMLSHVSTQSQKLFPASKITNVLKGMTREDSFDSFDEQVGEMTDLLEAESHDKEDGIVSASAQTGGLHDGMVHVAKMNGSFRHVSGDVESSPADIADSGEKLKRKNSFDSLFDSIRNDVTLNTSAQTRGSHDDERVHSKMNESSRQVSGDGELLPADTAGSGEKLKRENSFESLFDSIQNELY